MLAISFGERYKENDLTELRQQIGELATLGEWLEERSYGEKMIRTANVDRMRHLEQRMANDGHLTKLVRKARLTRLNKLTPDHQIIVKVIKRQSKITSEALWKAYQVECQRESRTPVSLQTFTNYVGRLIQLKLIHGSPKSKNPNIRIFTMVTP